MARRPMADAARRSRIRSKLRQTWLWYWTPAKEAKAAAKLDGGGYLCSACGGVFASSSVQVDHIVPCGSLKSDADLVTFVARLFAPADQYQVLCKACHQAKTNAERESRKGKE